ncbi:MAG: hypothetical protein KBF57_03230 [Saprospiraceae bacterium]|jgi:hypothetical protein|nr:hypothetical protein [Saprospiraceae bacterium]MBP9193667.1 hypothetical protein [Saprospiraceae bacterium]
MKILILFLASFILFNLSAQQFPNDAKVIQDVKKYHGKIATAEVQNDWKLEREAGYNFSNMAKRVVAATTQKENGISKKIIGLAIYTRGGSGESWHFSRYFVTGSEVTGAKSLTEEDLVSQTLDLLRTEPIKVFPDFGEIAWVWDVSFTDMAAPTTDRTGDLIYKGYIEFERKFTAYYPFEGGLRRYRSPIEAYVRLSGSQMKVAVVSVNFSEPIGEIWMKEKDYNALPVLGSKVFDELYGKNCPYSDKKEGKNEVKTDPIPSEKESSPEEKKKKKTFGLPKIKIKG